MNVEMDKILAFHNPPRHRDHDTVLARIELELYFRYDSFMPELPEVESVIRGLRDELIGRQLLGLECHWEKTLQGFTPVTFGKMIRGNTVTQLTRRGKYIIIHTDCSVIVIHLRMTGRLYLAQSEEKLEADRWLRVNFLLDDDWQLRFSDLRKFGRISLADGLASHFSHLGPEPLSEAFDINGFKMSCQARKKSIKTLLLDQGIVAGIGNIYADESCFLAGIHPTRPANSLTDSEVSRLHRCIRDVLRYAIQYEGSSFQWYRKPDGNEGNLQEHFYVFNRANGRCRSCEETIVKIRHHGRGTHFCPNCQPK